MDRLIAKHYKTGELFEVISKDKVGTLVKLKNIKTKEIIVSNQGYYTFSKVVDKTGLEKKKAKPTKEELIIKAYRDYITSPYSDGYTRVYLEGKFKMSIDEMRNIYKAHLKKQRKNITKAQAYDMIKELVEVYEENRRMGNLVSFPADDVIEIIKGCNK